MGKLPWVQAAIFERASQSESTWWPSSAVREVRMFCAPSMLQNMPEFSRVYRPRSSSPPQRCPSR